MKIYPVNLETLIIDPVTPAQQSALDVLRWNHPEASQIVTKSQATAFISKHEKEYIETCFMLAMRREIEMLKFLCSND